MKAGQRVRIITTAMELEDARNLKTKFLTTMVPEILADLRAKDGSTPMNRSGGTHGAERGLQPFFAAGIAREKAGNGYLLALRLAEEAFRSSEPVKRIIKEAASEVDIQIVGAIEAFHAHRPLRPGISVGHYSIPAGTLGAFVRPRGRGDGRVCILSNNHILADTNRGKVGDLILQPGRLDGGRETHDAVARLEPYQEIRFDAPNQIDAAIAAIVDGVEIDPGDLRGVASDILNFDEALEVMKNGRSTQLTSGVVTGVEMGGLSVSFNPKLSAVFDHQIEIQSNTRRPFSLKGDSGSLIVTRDGLGIGLLFAGGPGGSRNLGVTYANPLARVLDDLQVDLVTA